MPDPSSRIARPRWRLPILIFLVAALVRIVFLWLRGPQLAPDSSDYFRLAQNLLAHASFSLDSAAPFLPSIRWPPLYPVFIAALGAPSPMVICVVQAIFDSLTALILWFMAGKIMPRKWALAVALVYVVHPGAISATRGVLTETVFTTLLICAVWVLSLGLERDRFRLTILGGLLLGLTVLCRPIALLLPLVFWLPILWHKRWRTGLSQALILTAVTFAVVLPWSIRSSIVAGKLVTVQDSSVAAALFYAATRSDWDQKDPTLWPRYTEESKRIIRIAEASRPADSKDRVRPEQVLVREGIRNISAHPGQYVWLRVRNFPYLFVTSYDSATGINVSFGSLMAQRDLKHLALKGALLVIFSLVPFVLGVAGLIASRKSLLASLCAMVWLYVLVFYLPLWVEPRYWMPCIPFLLISAAVGARSLLTWVRGGSNLDNDINTERTS